MNFVPAPNVDDYSVIFNLCRNHKLKYFPELSNMQASLISAYTLYRAQNGNVDAIPPAGLEEIQSDALHYYYNSPSKEVSFINTIRDDNAHKVCAMCGSFGSETLDHVLPQAEYPEFSVLSSNLVPACPCNSKRSNTAKGAVPGERVLHPYFDRCLSNRLVVMQIDGAPEEVVLISLKMVMPSVAPYELAVKFHIENVVLKTAVINHLETKWTHLGRSPDLIIPTLTNNIISVRSLKRLVIKELRRLDTLHGSKNNWDSIFVAGLLDGEILKWVAARHNLKFAPVAIAAHLP